MKNQFNIKSVSLAVKAAFGLTLLAGSSHAFAQEQVSATNAVDENAMEEVVAVASRLQGSAVAVVEERRNQAFVADIMGSEQISKTGDSDAASALRRVTGLTLVDGKYIYVRGLGERYSSARLNVANIPSPDLTRNVIPLDLFPSSIIESLSVQKAFSPSMPAAFGGGAIDIRTKSVPSDFIANVEVGIGHNTESTEGNTFSASHDGIPAELTQAMAKYGDELSVSSIYGVENSNGTIPSGVDAGDYVREINAGLLKSLPTNLGMENENLTPAYSLKANIGNSFSNVLGGEVGVLAAIAYDNKQKYAKKFTAVMSENFSEGCSTTLNSLSDAANSCYNTTKDSEDTTTNERLSGVLNLGYKVKNHEVSWSNIYLKDSEEESSIDILQSPNSNGLDTIVSTGVAERSHEFLFEERELLVTQFVGKHTFNDLMGLGIDWQATQSTATTDIPTNVKFKFFDNYDTSTGDYLSTSITGDDDRIIASFLDMEDKVASYGANATLPIYLDKSEIVFKAGFDYSDKTRDYTTTSFGVNNTSKQFLEVSDTTADILGMTTYVTDENISAYDLEVDAKEPTGNEKDDYSAEQVITALYGEFDVFYDQSWRLSGGLRWEEYKQETFTSKTYTVDESEFYPSLALTFIGGESYQLRASYGKTVVRPDLREVVPVTYYDPLTDIRTIGREDLDSSPVNHFDLRYEHFSTNGDNFTVSAFYKDIQSPIESVLRAGDVDYSLSYVNGEEASVYGVEAEWLYDLSWLSDGFFTSGNITLSDSEVSIDPSLGRNLTKFTKRLNGHSQYVANLQFNYDSADGNHSSSVVYNVFGERILASGVSGVDDAYEQPFHSLDVVYTYYPSFDSKLKFKVQNLLNESQEVTQNDIVVRAKDVGISLGLTYSYDF